MQKLFETVYTSALLHAAVAKKYNDKAPVGILRKKCKPLAASVAGHLRRLLARDSGGILSFSNELIENLAASPQLLRLILEDCAYNYLGLNKSLFLPESEFQALPQKSLLGAHLIAFNAEFFPASDPKISVIIPAYNASQTIRRCLESVLTQDNSSFEIIIVDDSSTDDTFFICQEFALKDPRIRLFKTPWNIRQGAIRNFALHKARGRFVTFLDSDDWFEQSFFSRGLHEFANFPKAEIIFFKSRRLYGNMRRSNVVFSNVEDGVESGEGCLKNFLWGEYKHWEPWSILFNRDFILEHQVSFGTNFNEDILFLTQAFAHAQQVRFSSFIAYTSDRKGVKKQSGTRINVPRGRKHFYSYIQNVKLLNNFFFSHFRDANDSKNIYSQLQMPVFFRSHHCLNIFTYIEACRRQKKESPLSEQILGDLASSHAFLRLLLRFYGELLQPISLEKKYRSVSTWRQVMTLLLLDRNRLKNNITRKHSCKNSKLLFCARLIPASDHSALRRAYLEFGNFFFAPMGTSNISYRLDQLYRVAPWLKKKIVLWLLRV